MERKVWLAARKHGIGGSDAAAILGMSPWKSAMDVWLDKMGQVPERTDPDKEFLFDLGLRLEPVIAGLYERETHKDIVIPAQGIFSHALHPILIGSPDRIGADALGDGPKFGVELKTENQFSDFFGEPGTDEVPRHYLIQCAHYMNVLDFDTWDLAVLHGGVKFSVYTIHRDRELEQMMTEQLLAWWERHIAHGVPPEVDSSDAWRVYLHEKHPLNILPMTDIDPEKQGLIGKLGQVRHAEKVLTGLRDELENQLKAVIGDRDGVYSEDGKVTWKKTKDSKHVDWQSAFISLRTAIRVTIQKTFPSDAGLLAETLKTYDTLAALSTDYATTTKPGVRRFLFTPRKDSHGLPEHTSDSTEAGRTNAALPQPGDSQHGARGTSESSD